MANVAAPQPNTQLTDQQRKALASITPPKKDKDQRISTQNHLMFSEVRDNIVIMRDGSLRMVILASSLNFDLKSAREQGAIEYSYQNFLNGLHFPIQVIVRSRKIDLDNYLAKLETRQAEQENSLLAGLMEDYIYNIRGLLEDVNIMSKSFYVVVPYYVQTVSKDNILSKIGGLLKPSEDVIQSDTEFGEHKRDLIQRTNIVAQGLAQIGVRAAVLGTQELIELFYGSYNIDESQNQPLADVRELGAPVVGRGGAPAHPATPVQRPADPDDLFSSAQRQPQAPQPTVPAAPVATPAAQPVAPVAAQPAPAPQVVQAPQPTQAPAPTSASTPAPQPVSQQMQPGQAVQMPPTNPQQGGQK